MGFGAAPGFACIRFASFKPFWPLALLQQAPPAIIFAALRRFRGAALFPGPRPSSRLGAPFWPSGLTVRRSRPPTAAAELRALACEKPALFSPMFYSPAFIFSSGYSLGFGFLAGLRLLVLRQFSAFLPALRRFRGTLLFRGLSPSLIQQFLFWLLGLTGQSSRPAFGRRLTFVR